MSATLDGPALVAGILAKKALTTADEAYTTALQAAVGGYGDWAHVRQAGEVVKQARATLTKQEASK